jgi:hypothetical protein
MPSILQAFLNFKEFINFCKSHGSILSEGFLFIDSSRAWTLASTRRLWFSSQRSWSVNWFSKQSAITLAVSNRRNLNHQSSISSWCPWSIPLYNGFRIGPYSLRCDIRVTSFLFPPFKCLSTGHSSVCATQLTADLHAVSLISCTIFLAPASVLTNDLNQGDHCLVPKV